MDGRAYGRSLTSGIIKLAVLAAIAGGAVVGLLFWAFS